MNIWVSWTFSSWKSTLINALKKEAPFFNIVEETARELIIEQNIDINKLEGKELAYFQLAVFHRQKKKEREAEGNYVNIMDTTLIDMLAYWADASNIERLTREVIQYYKKKVYDIIFYLPPEIPLENDWVRHTDNEYRMVIDTRIKQGLHNLKRTVSWVRIVVLTWSVQERVAKAMEEIYTH